MDRQRGWGWWLKGDCCGSRVGLRPGAAVTELAPGQLAGTALALDITACIRHGPRQGRCRYAGQREALISPRPLVLVIDDSAETRKLYALVLELEGYVVAQARDGRDGLQQARDLVPDIIITDLAMPIMDGWETIRRLRADPRTRHIPIIACSGDGAGQRMDRAAPEVLLAKPCPLDMLVAEVRRLVQRAA